MRSIRIASIFHCVISIWLLPFIAGSEKTSSNQPSSQKSWWFFEWTFPKEPAKNVRCIIEIQSTVTFWAGKSLIDSTVVRIYWNCQHDAFSFHDSFFFSYGWKPIKNTCDFATRTFTVNPAVCFLIQTFLRVIIFKLKIKTLKKIMKMTYFQWDWWNVIAKCMCDVWVREINEFIPSTKEKWLWESFISKIDEI